MFNGDSANLDKSLYTVLNVSLPESEENSMLLFNLDFREYLPRVEVRVRVEQLQEAMYSVRCIRDQSEGR